MRMPAVQSDGKGVAQVAGKSAEGNGSMGRVMVSVECPANVSEEAFEFRV